MASNETSAGTSSGAQTWTLVSPFRSAFRRVRSRARSLVSMAHTVASGARLARASAIAPDPPPPATGHLLDLVNRGHVRLDGVIVDRAHAVHALPGVAENRTGQDLAMVQLMFGLYDASGAKVADAVAHSNGLKKGDVWKFRAAGS